MTTDTQALCPACNGEGTSAGSEADILRIADKYGQRWRSSDEEGVSFEKSQFFDFVTELLACRGGQHA